MTVRGQSNFQLDEIEENKIVGSKRTQQNSTVYVPTMNKSKTKFDYVFYFTPVIREKRVKL
jgi:hypothetical protein